ncbi:TrmH family RNA methyltransferase [Xylanimonas allomyrinae]|uniref:TrmH family RNA methyltransferase n=1 Tax=Xylanimonas allomyrinae TaxID=2509459 RepID=A0A4P6EN57_9MICO|nr:TrmH family RNA methyltransferase [Xylanimonas allomyrinae]QAY63816.1 TrmH family RNA methyltransferase [Xylanimonas allomyrinae]
MSEPASAAATDSRGHDESVGVGPWLGEWPDGPQWDPELLEHGDRRNVVDEFRYWSVAAIAAELDARRDPARVLHVAIENWAHDFNIGSVVRTANAYNVAGVHIVGRRRWNRRGAMVTDRYLHVHHHSDAAALAAWAEAEGLPLVGVDNVPGSRPVEGYALPPRCVLVLGQESTGLTPAMQAACDVVVHITQYGSTRSLNAGAAAAIAMYAWSHHHPPR